MPPGEGPTSRDDFRRQSPGVDHRAIPRQEDLAADLELMRALPAVADAQPHPAAAAD